MKLKSPIQNIGKALTMMIALSGCKISEKNIDNSEIQSTDAVDGARDCLDDKTPAIKGFYIQKDGNIIPYCGLKNWKELGIEVRDVMETTSGELAGLFEFRSGKPAISCGNNTILVSATITNDKLVGKCASLKGTTYGVKSEATVSEFTQENILDGSSLKKIECPANQYVRILAKGANPGDIAIRCAEIIKNNF